MKKIALSLMIVIALLSALTVHMNQRQIKVTEVEVTMHRGYTEDVGLPDGPGR